MERYDIVPAHLAVTAMRDSGYKNAAYAIAELIDNSIQAGASTVELLCGEEINYTSGRGRTNIREIAVLDNGSGMDRNTLRMALQFGNGTHLSPETQKGIGKFGMGLPSSSISQCQRVDVWSWQNGKNNAIYSYLDINEIKDNKLKEVPEPVQRNIPEIWEKIGNSFKESGTLVVWSRIDKCLWKTAPTIIKHSELLVGRIYRKFIQNDRVKIRMAQFDLGSPKNLTEKMAIPNDPMYLIKKTSCPDPFSNVPMFKEYGEIHTIPISFRGKTHNVKITYSYAKEEARKGNNPGSRPHGKHAAKNVGVSIIRADREIELDSSWAVPYDPTERWWGVEVDFPPALDDLFGLTNNKQSVRNFSELTNFDYDEYLDNKSFGAFMDELDKEGDPRGPLLIIAQRIIANLRTIRELLKVQTKGERSKKRRYDEDSPEARATRATRKREAEGYSGGSDADEKKSEEVRKKELKGHLEETGYTEEQAEEITARIFKHGLKYEFSERDIETPAFFSVKPKGGVIIITLNTDHPAYYHLVEVLEKDTDEANELELRERLQKARNGLKLLFYAWARYEDEQPDGSPRSQVQDARIDWGRIARNFLESE